MSTTVFLGIPRVSVGLFDRAATSSRHIQPLLRQGPLLGRARSTVAFRPETSALVAQSRKSRHTILPSQSLSLRLLGTRNFTSSTPRANSTKGSPAAPQEKKEPLSTEPAKKESEDVTELHESPYTLPNALTLARIAACPFLGYAIVDGHFELATGILVVGGFTDWLDGFLARRWNQKSVLGSILDPMADKALMTTLVVTLTYKGLLPLPLAVIIFGRDLALSLWAFYLRYQSIPPPRTLKRYFDVSMPSAEVQPTQISKINTALQLLLMGITTISPMVTAFPMDGILQVLQWTVAVTTIWSGFSYVGASGYKFLKQPGAKKKL